MQVSSRILSLIYKNLFAGRNFRFKGRKIPLKRVRGLKAYKIVNLLFIEQNPKTDSKYARMAKRGRKIMWVIDQRKNEYLARVIDGKIERLA